jgi:hypothetical protein
MKRNNALSEQVQNKISKSFKIDTPNTHIHDRSLSWVGTGTSIKCGGIEHYVGTVNLKI